jgi:hypothetical protein
MFVRVPALLVPSSAAARAGGNGGVSERNATAVETAHGKAGTLSIPRGQGGIEGVQEGADDHRAEKKRVFQAPVETAPETAEEAEEAGATGAAGAAESAKARQKAIQALKAAEATALTEGDVHSSRITDRFKEGRAVGDADEIETIAGPDATSFDATSAASHNDAVADDYFATVAAEADRPGGVALPLASTTLGAEMGEEEEGPGTEGWGRGSFVAPDGQLERWSIQGVDLSASTVLEADTEAEVESETQTEIEIEVKN